jgi:hypothetical protein
MWVQQSGSNYYLYYKNLLTGARGFLTGTYTVADVNDPISISGIRVAWIENRNGKYVVINKLIA